MLALCVTWDEPRPVSLRTRPASAQAGAERAANVTYVTPSASLSAPPAPEGSEASTDCSQGALRIRLGFGFFKPLS